MSSHLSQVKIYSYACEVVGFEEGGIFYQIGLAKNSDEARVKKYIM